MDVLFILIFLFFFSFPFFLVFYFFFSFLFSFLFLFSLFILFLFFFLYEQGPGHNRRRGPAYGQCRLSVSLSVYRHFDEGNKIKKVCVYYRKKIEEYSRGVLAKGRGARGYMTAPPRAKRMLSLLASLFAYLESPPRSLVTHRPSNVNVRLEKDRPSRGRGSDRLFCTRESSS